MEFNEQKKIEALDMIGKTIGYGRAMQILCQLWDDMLQIEYDIPPFHEKNWCVNERKYMAEVENILRPAGCLVLSEKDCEFMSKRLAIVAKMLGIPMPGNSHAQNVELAGTVLGQIRRKIEGMKANQ